LKRCAIDCTDFVPKTSASIASSPPNDARTAEDKSAKSDSVNNSVKVELGQWRIAPRTASVGTAVISETQDLERQIQRSSEIIGAGEVALKAKAMSASDYAWVTSS
jgi:hypothetical protein